MSTSKTKKPAAKKPAAKPKAKSSKPAAKKDPNPGADKSNPQLEEMQAQDAPNAMNTAAQHSGAVHATRGHWTDEVKAEED